MRMLLIIVVIVFSGFTLKLYLEAGTLAAFRLMNEAELNEDELGRKEVQTIKNQVGWKVLGGVLLQITLVILVWLFGA